MALSVAVTRVTYYRSIITCFIMSYLYMLK